MQRNHKQRTTQSGFRTAIAKYMEHAYSLKISFVCSHIVTYRKYLTWSSVGITGGFIMETMQGKQHSLCLLLSGMLYPKQQKRICYDKNIRRHHVLCVDDRLQLPPDGKAPEWC